MSVTSGYYSNGNSERAETSGSQTEKRAEKLRGRMLVKMDFTDRNNGKQNAAMKRWKKNRSEAHSRIRILVQEREQLKTKLKSTQRALQRLQQARKVSSPHAELTPSNQTEQEMNDANLNQFQSENFRRRLLLGNVITIVKSNAQETTYLNTN
ncbi:hypothetical protein DPMN_050593 [Dreissena polymorpha]|uniref:Uncharacterized protein n=1 Tax=Dreissena polymorpha TaxID=45954 RepID=A0A9D4CHI5_DREPO|nr:hypothetical protein DPMN_050593 [Dreissena polymorpha]